MHFNRSLIFNKLPECSLSTSSSSHTSCVVGLLASKYNFYPLSRKTDRRKWSHCCLYFWGCPDNKKHPRFM